MERWEKPPDADSLLKDYLIPAQPVLDVILAPLEAEGIAADLKRMKDWRDYRTSILRMDPLREEERLRGHLLSVENLFDLKLKGEVTLFGAFKYLDGYARFDSGTHRVFLGIDESFEDGAYIDILTAHELSHVARESRPTVWEGFGLNPIMTQDEFTELQPVIEHVFGEGLSCAASEVIVPGQDPWLYAYQTQATYARVLEQSAQVGEVIKRALAKDTSDYGLLYQTRQYGLRMPAFTHYVWAWHWVRQAVNDLAHGNYPEIVPQCSKEFRSHALAFELGK